MTRDDFKSAKNIAELYALARKFKAAGEDPGKVNTLMAERKKEFLQSVRSVQTLNKIVNKLPAKSSIAVVVPTVKNLNGNKIVIKGMSQVEI